MKGKREKELRTEQLKISAVAVHKQSHKLGLKWEQFGLDSEMWRTIKLKYVSLDKKVQ